MGRIKEKKKEKKREKGRRNHYPFSQGFE